MKRKSNSKIYDVLNKKMPDYLIQAGWFEESKYSNGTPIGAIAAVQNFGAHISQNVSEKQRTFLHYLGIHLKKTTNNINIVIPPTHFMENCQNKNKEKWRKEINYICQQVFLGNINPDKAMEQIGIIVASDIGKEISQGDYPPDKPSTVKAKMNRYKNNKIKGDLDKRLVDTGQMFAAISHKVEKI